MNSVREQLQRVPGAEAQNTQPVTERCEACAAKKVAKNALREPGGYDFTPLVVESYGHQCSATHTLLNLLRRLAADSGRGSRVRCGD